MMMIMEIMMGMKDFNKLLLYINNNVKKKLYKTE